MDKDDAILWITVSTNQISISCQVSQSRLLNKYLILLPATANIKYPINGEISFIYFIFINAKRYITLSELT